LRRALSSLRVGAGQPRERARQAHETHEEIADESSQPRGSRGATCAWVRRAEPAADARYSDGANLPSRRVTNYRSDDPGPRSRCAAALSSVPESSGYIALGARKARSSAMRRSTRMGRSPKAAKWLRLRPRTSPIPLLGAAADIMASWPERELKQALLPAAIGSRADMAYSDAASTQNEVSHSELHRVDSDLAGAVQAALATIYIAHGSHAKPRIADARSTRHVVMPRSG
jgi:hypothetical protein